MSDTHPRPLWLRPAWLFLFLGLLGTLPLAVLMPPFQVPDEGQHFERAYQISEGRLWSVTNGAASGAVLPSALPELVERFLGTRNIYPEHFVTSVPYQVTLQELQRPLQPERREFVEFTGAAFYSPITYLPQAIAIAIGRWAGVGPLGLLYLGRWTNALFAVSFMAWAISMLPRGQHAAFILGLLPIALQQYASVSPDASVITSATLFSAVVLRAAVTGSWNRSVFLIAGVSGLVFCPLKPVYAPLLLLGLPAIMRTKRYRTALIGYAVMLLIVLIGTAAWMAVVSSMIQVRSGVNVATQLQTIWNDPLSVATAMMTRTLYEGMTFAVHIVGRLGWNQVLLPSVAYVLPAMALTLSAVSSPQDRPGLSVTDRVWALLLVAASYILILLAFWLLWTRVGDGAVSGTNGRYYLPFLGIVSVVAGSMVRPLRFGFLLAASIFWWLTLIVGLGDFWIPLLAIPFMPKWLRLAQRVGSRSDIHRIKTAMIGVVCLIEIAVVIFTIASAYKIFS